MKNIHTLKNRKQIYTLYNVFIYRLCKLLLKILSSQESKEKLLQIKL